MRRRKAQAIQARQSTEMVALMLPVSGKHLLLPSVALAEITPMPEEVRPVSEGPNWLLGWIIWRELDIPVISFEGINDEPFAPASIGQRIAVVNGLVDPERMAFYAVALQAMPRLFRISDEDVQENADAVRGVAESMAVYAEGAPALIPDLEYIERQLLSAL